MQRGRRAARIELAIAADGLVRRHHLDLDTALPQLLERLGVVRTNSNPPAPRPTG
jgi:hypothetical protein